MRVFTCRFRGNEHAPADRARPRPRRLALRLVATPTRQVGCRTGAAVEVGIRIAWSECGFTPGGGARVPLRSSHGCTGNVSINY